MLAHRVLSASTDLALELLVSSCGCSSSLCDLIADTRDVRQTKWLRLLETHNHPCNIPSTFQTIHTQLEKSVCLCMQVLEALPVNVAIQVLRSMSHSFRSNFMHLPHSLKPMAALAEHPGLASACVLPMEGSGTEREANLPCLTLCVDTVLPISTDQAGTDSSSDQHCSSQDFTKTPMWQKVVERTQQDDHLSCLVLEASAGTVACQLVARAITLQDLTINLNDMSCILLGPACSNMKLKNVKFTGMAQLPGSFVVLNACSLQLKLRSLFQLVAVSLYCI